MYNTVVYLGSKQYNYAMDWILYAILSALSLTAFAIIVRKSLLKGSDATAFTVLNNFTAGIILFCFALVLSPVIAITPFQIILIVLASTLFALSSLLFTKGRQIEEVGMVSIVRQTSVFWIFIGGYVFFGEAVTLPKVIGTALLFAGTWIALWHREGLSITKGVVYIVVGAFSLSISTLIAKDIVDDNLSPALYSGILFTLAGLWLLPFIREKGRITKELTLQKWNVVIVSFFIALSVVFLYSGYKIGEVSKVFPVYSSYVILSVIAGMIFLNERTYIKRKILGSLVALSGVILLVAF